MSDCYGGLQALIWDEAPDALWMHCVINRQALASKYLSPLSNKVIETVMKVVNFMKLDL
jgi:hypothetical protein